MVGIQASLSKVIVSSSVPPENNVMTTKWVLKCTHLPFCHRIIGFGMFECVCLLGRVGS
jgi:hypothetical protein